MTDIIIIAVIVLVVGGAIAYIIKEKKKGRKSRNTLPNINSENTISSKE